MPDKTEGHASASAEAIRSHYDVENGFFAAWLDESMTYSAARWDDGPVRASRLRQAQFAKMDWHLDAAAVHGGSLLDIGCGWGGLLQRAAAKRGVTDLVGITALASQADWIRRHNGTPPIEVVTLPRQVVDPNRTFDAIVSIGAIEHFAGPGLGSDERVRIYRDFFRYCHRRLRPGGRMSIQFIARMDLKGRPAEQFLPLELFPQSRLPYPIEVLTAADADFQPLALENRPADSSKTLAAWLENLNAHRDNSVVVHEQDLAKRYIRGFRRLVLGFEGGSIGLFRAALLRR